MADLAQRTADLLKMSSSADKPLSRALPPGSGVQSLGPVPANMPESLKFSVFVPEHQEKALQLVARFMEVANAEPGESGLDKVLQLAAREAKETGVALTQYALMVFITHHPNGQSLPIPDLEERSPEAVKPSPKPSAVDVAPLGATGAEAALDYYREDIEANQHHERWHVVYPFRGVPDPLNPLQRKEKNRQGELFMYMHQQMLARYDAERVCAGLAPVVSLSNFSTPMPEGYSPMLSGYSDRPANSLLKDSLSGSLNLLKSWDTLLFSDALKKSATFATAGGAVVVTPNLLGATVEASLASANPSRYGGLHNQGHVEIALVPPATEAVPGVMYETSVAIRDPIFYRWHRHIDDLMAGWQDKQGAVVLPTAPPATMRKSLDGSNPTPPTSPDIILCQADKVVGEPQAFGDANFGGANWNADASSSGLATNTLRTMMKSRVVAGATVDYLDHEDFFYFFRLSNDTAAEQKLTVRVFVAPAFNGFQENRRNWIELDKFQYSLAANAKAVVARSSRHSSVVRKPAIHPGEPKPPAEPGADPNYCDCGWPYHLLLPRGTKTGSAFRLMVMLTNWNDDKVEVEGKCGSMSFCGKRDRDYPDRMPMGFPFHGPWSAGITQTIADTKSMVARDITIQWV